MSTIARPTLNYYHDSSCEFVPVQEGTFAASLIFSTYRYQYIVHDNVTQDDH
jgi:hypothetical protein